MSASPDAATFEDELYKHLMKEGMRLVDFRDDRMLFDIDIYQAPKLPTTFNRIDEELDIKEATIEQVRDWMGGERVQSHSEIDDQLNLIMRLLIKRALAYGRDLEERFVSHLVPLRSATTGRRRFRRGHVYWYKKTTKAMTPPEHEGLMFFVPRPHSKGLTGAILLTP